MSEDISLINQGMGRREYLRCAQRMADRRQAERCLRVNARMAVQVVLFVAALAVLCGIVNAIF